MTKVRPEFCESEGRDGGIAAIRRRLARLESEKAELRVSSGYSPSTNIKERPAPIEAAPVTSASSPVGIRLSALTYFCRRPLMALSSGNFKKIDR